MSKHSSLAKNFKVGDKVFVSRRAEPFEYGWSLTWILDMDAAIGKTLEVLGVNYNNGCLLNWGRSKHDECWFPFTVLTKVNAPKKKRNSLAGVFRSAALNHLSVEGHYPHPCSSFSCIALDYSCRKQKKNMAKAAELYAEYFKPDGQDVNGCWYDYNNYASLDSRQEHRCLSLLLMEEIIADLA